ncbi:MAG TPA: hypothetical protein VK721_10970 [Solirubrobacteraceae bacterium]|jgi:hypothetical protein|nr:hypothetical protein [Solirubrobacteraceae bacterium]
MPELVVDFNDPASIAEAIPQAEALIREAEHRVTAAIEEATRARERASDAELAIQRLRAVLLTLEQLSRGEMPPPPDSAEEGSKDQALKVVITINGPTNIAEVAEHMPGFSPKTVSWALWKLADEGAIQRVGHGLYAPLGYVPGQPTMNYFQAPPGFPVPSRAQIAQAAEAALAAARAGQPEDE